MLTILIQIMFKYEDINIAGAQKIPINIVAGDQKGPIHIASGVKR